MRYVDMIEDESGDLVDLNVYCSPGCFRAGTGVDPHGHAWPCPEKADYRQYCPNCGVVAVAMLEEPSFDSWPDDEYTDAEGTVWPACVPAYDRA